MYILRDRLKQFEWTNEGNGGMASSPKKLYWWVGEMKGMRYKSVQAIHWCPLMHVKSLNKGFQPLVLQMVIKHLEKLHWSYRIPGSPIWTCKAMPALTEALGALDTLSAKDIGEIKAMKNPPGPVPWAEKTPGLFEEGHFPVIC